ARGGRPQPLEAVRGFPGRHIRPGAGPVLCRQLHRPDGRGPGGRASAAQAPGGGLSRASPPVNRVVRTTSVIVAVGVVIALVRFFQVIVAPLIVATFLMLLIDAVTRVIQGLAPGAPSWVRRGTAGVIILAGFLLVGGALALEAPAFGARMQALGPRLND